jgi:hypothetical protein
MCRGDSCGRRAFGIVQMPPKSEKQHRRCSAAAAGWILFTWDHLSLLFTACESRRLLPPVGMQVGAYVVSAPRPPKKLAERKIKE